MILEVLTPVGPGHEHHMARCAESVRLAVSESPGPFTKVVHRWADDTEGKTGRSEARNGLMASSQADWVFFLDADDLMHPHALSMWREGYEAIWGEQWFMSDAWKLGVTRIDALLGASGRFGMDLSDLSFCDAVLKGPWGTVSMGHFVLGDVARATPFLPYMDSGEDFEHHLTVMSRYRWIKVDGPLALIQNGGSAVGPRRAAINWSYACRRVLDFWAQRGAFPISDEWRARDHYWVGHTDFLEGGIPLEAQWLEQAAEIKAVRRPD